MINQASQIEELASSSIDPGDEHIAPAPRVSIQAFCETVETAAAIQSAGEDRRLGKAHLKIQMGGVTAAVEAYRGTGSGLGAYLDLGDAIALPDPRLAYDGMHLNAEGNQIIAQALVAPVERLMPEAFVSPSAKVGRQ